MSFILLGLVKSKRLRRISTPAGRNEEHLSYAAKYAQAIAISGSIIRMVPIFMKPYVSPSSMPLRSKHTLHHSSTVSCEKESMLANGHVFQIYGPFDCTTNAILLSTMCEISASYRKATYDGHGKRESRMRFQLDRASE